MAIRRQNQVKSDFSSSTMSDLVFLLLIFFMLTSTLIAPNAVKLLLPESTSKTMAKQNVTVYINDDFTFFVEETPTSIESLESAIEHEIAGIENGSIVLRADKAVPVQYVVNVIDAVNAINNKYGTLHKVILATSPKQ
ncbi:biopolymer transporter ExbD [Bacteroidales bacterium OttesenSCG-928-C19]|nr:biopolymer transporter ExbD [Bacteroidales bacterium OttesenSCG-928-C19]